MMSQNVEGVGKKSLKHIIPFTLKFCTVRNHFAIKETCMTQWRKFKNG